MKKMLMLLTAVIFAVSLLTFASCKGKAPTLEECKKETEKLEKWGDANKDKADEIQKKYEKDLDIDPADPAKGPTDEELKKMEKAMAAMLKDGLKAAGGNVKCGDVLAAETMKQMKALKESLGDMGNPEIAPEPAPEVTPEPAPEVIPEPAPEVTPEPAPEVAPEPAPESGEVTPE